MSVEVQLRHVIVVGTTEPQEFALVDRGVAINGLGLDIALEIYRVVGVATLLEEDAPTVTWLDTDAGTVSVDGVENLEVGSYYVRYRLTDGDANVGFCPNGKKADLWIVVPVAGLIP
jgi:hypothetical protein